MGFVDILVIAVLAAVIGAGVYLRRRRKKRGDSCCGCSGCSACRGCSTKRDQ